MNLYEAINNPNLTDNERWDIIDALIAEFDAILPDDPGNECGFHPCGLDRKECEDMEE